MAKIHGISNCTRYLLKGTRPINEKKLASFEEIHYFHKNYEKILADAQAVAVKKQDAIIQKLSNDETILNSYLQEGIARRTIEIDEHLHGIESNVKNAAGFFPKLRCQMHYWFARRVRSYRINRPFYGVRWDLHNIRSLKNRTISCKPFAVRDACKNITNTQRFLVNNYSFFSGAIGEESVIDVLSQLPDGYHVLNDVNLYFNESIYFRNDDRIKTSQIDHIVIGPTGIYLLETKNWKREDIEKKSKDLKYQVDRANRALWCYLTDNFSSGKKLHIWNIVVSLHGAKPGQKIGKYVSVISPDRLCGHITYGDRVLSEETIHKLIRLIPCNETD